VCSIRRQRAVFLVHSFSVLTTPVGGLSSVLCSALKHVPSRRTRTFLSLPRTFFYVMLN